MHKLNPNIVQVYQILPNKTNAKKINLEKVLVYLGKVWAGKQGMGTAQFQTDIICF